MRTRRQIAVILIVILLAVGLAVHASENYWCVDLTADNGAGNGSSVPLRIGVTPDTSDGVDTYKDLTVEYRRPYCKILAYAVAAIQGDSDTTYLSDFKAGDLAAPKTWVLRVDTGPNASTNQIRLRFSSTGLDYLPPSSIDGLPVRYVLKMVDNRGVPGAPANGTEWLLPEVPASSRTVWFTVPALLPARHLANDHRTMLDNGYILEFRQELVGGGVHSPHPPLNSMQNSSLESMTLTEGSIAWAKSLDDDEEVSLTDKVVTVGPGLFNGFTYIEEQDRSSGIRVACTSGCPDLWKIVSVSGAMDTTATGERYIADATITPSEDSLELKPVSIVNRDLGGEASGLQQGITGGYGVNNIGLLVSTLGKITYRDSAGAFFYLDDGSALADGSGNVGVRVETDQLAAGNGITLPSGVGDMVRIRGISSCATPGGTNLIRVLRPRTQSDIFGQYVVIGDPSPSVTRHGPVTYTVTYQQATSITLSPTDITLNATGAADGTVSVSGSESTTRTVTISDITGDGTLGITIAAGTGSDSSSAPMDAAGPSKTFVVDNTAPTIGSASAPEYTGTTPITVSYTGAADTGSGLSKVELWYKNGLQGLWADSGLTATSESGSFDFTPTDEGPYYFDVIAQDAAGNRSADPSQEESCCTVYSTGIDSSGRASVVTEYLYPGGPAVRVDAFDGSGNRVRQVTNTYGSEGELLSHGGDTEPAAYTYDALYRVKSISDGKGQTTGYTYDNLGNLTRVQYPDTTAVTFDSFDANGNVLQRTDAKGVIARYSYNDPESLLTSVHYPSASDRDVSFSYDGYGRLQQTMDGEGTYSYIFDHLGLPTTVTTQYDLLPAKNLTYAYYANGSLKTVGTPAGEFSYTYDSGGRPNDIENPSGEKFSWTYKNNNWLETQTLKNASNVIVAASAYGYDGRGLLTSLANKNSAEQVLSEFSVPTSTGYDSLGNLHSVVANIPGMSGLSGTTDYTYNTKNQLTAEETDRSGGYTHGFVYDSAGNPTTFEGSTRSYNNKNQNTAFGFDSNGNPFSYKGSTLTYDVNDNLTAYGSAMTAGYTAGGLRAWKQVGGQRTYFLYAGGVPVFELDSAGNIIATNTFGPTGLLARHEGETNSFYIFDTQGNVAQTLDSSGAPTSTLVYDAYGSLVAGTPTTPYGYGGQSGYYTDPETGLLLLTHRYYDPSEGRFLTRDPIGYLGGLNLYGYCGGDPVNAADPSGFCGNKDGLDILSDICAGFGDSATFGLTGAIRGAMGCNDVVDEASIGYFGGGIASTIVQAIATGGGSTAAKGLVGMGRNAKGILGAAGVADDVLRGSGGLGKVYVLVDEAGKVRYVGRTANEVVRRNVWKRALPEMDFRVLARDLSPEEARGVEQFFIEAYGGGSKNGGDLINRINGVNPKTQFYDIAQDAAASVIW